MGVSGFILVHVFSSCIWSLVPASPLFCIVCCSTVFFICFKSQQINGIAQVLDRNTPMLGNAGESASSRLATVSTSTLSGITPSVAVAPVVFEACCHVSSWSSVWAAFALSGVTSVSACCASVTSVL